MVTPRRFKTFVGNKVSEIMDLIPPRYWNHVQGSNDPADCASRVFYAKELKHNETRWYGPNWLKDPQSKWPTSTKQELLENPVPCEKRKEETELSLIRIVEVTPLEKISNLTWLIRITAWILRFIHNAQLKENRVKTPLTTNELMSSQELWIRRSLSESFTTEIVNIRKGKPAGTLIQYRSFVDKKGIIRVGGRTTQVQMIFSFHHPIILHGKHLLVRLVIKSEHEQLLHTGLTLTLASLHRRYCIVKGRGVALTIIRDCVVYRKIASKPSKQVLGQLPANHLRPGIVFENVGVDYAGPVLVKSG